MIIRQKKERAMLFIGDIIFFITTLWLTLFLRYFEIPNITVFYSHLIPFSFLFIVWIIVFFIAGLYDKHTVIFKRRLPSIILNAQIVNIVFAAIFFFFIPYFGITPKTNLFIYLYISFVVADTGNEKISSVMPFLYNIIFIQSSFRFLDFQKMYENIFDRVPLSLVKYNWFLSNVQWLPKITHDLVKRLADIVFSIALGILSLPVYPLVFLAVKLGDKGPLFIIQERVGMDNRPIYIFKFRSMSIYEREKITKVGGIINKGPL